MAASAPIMNLNLNGGDPPRFSPHSYAASGKIVTLRNNFNDLNLPFSSSASICIGSRTTQMNRPMPAGATGSFRVPDSSSLTFDVVVVGAGIIGLTIARHFLLHSNLSVALVDAAVPCAGATGAGRLASIRRGSGSRASLRLSVPCSFNNYGSETAVWARCSWEGFQSTGLLWIRDSSVGVTLLGGFPVRRLTMDLPTSVKIMIQFFHILHQRRPLVWLEFCLVCAVRDRNFIGIGCSGEWQVQDRQWGWSWSARGPV